MGVPGVVAMTRMRFFLTGRVFLTGFVAAGAIALASLGNASERTNFLDAGAEKLTTQELEKLFSDSKFFGNAYSVTNRADGTRQFEARDFFLNLRWWVDAAGRFCTDTRSGMELCGIEYYLRKDKLKTFNGAGDTLQEFVVKQ